MTDLTPEQLEAYRAAIESEAADLMTCGISLHEMIDRLVARARQRKWTERVLADLLTTILAAWIRKQKPTDVN